MKERPLARGCKPSECTYLIGHKATIKSLERDAEEAQARQENAERDLATLQARGLVVVKPREREKLPDERRSEAWTLRIGTKKKGAACTIHLGYYDDGRLGEVFLRFDKRVRGTEGASMADLACTYLSIGLQYGVPLAEMVRKMVGAGDESGGFTAMRQIDDRGKERWVADPEVPRCQSLRDYLGKKLRIRFVPKEDW